MSTSACYGYTNKETVVTKARDTIWENGATCWKKYFVKCIGGTNLAPYACEKLTIKVTSVDYCPPRCCGTINLSKDAFTIIYNPNAGIIKIEYLE